MRGFFSLLTALLLPLPVAAEIQPASQRALQTCAAPALPFADRVDQLTALGWLPLAPDQVEVAALTFAPYDLVLIQGYGALSAWDIPEAMEMLQSTAERNADLYARLSVNGALMALPTGELIKIELSPSDPLRVSCLSSLAGVTVPEVEAAISVTLEDIGHLSIRMFIERSDSPDRPMDVNFLDFAPHAFGEHVPTPLVMIFSPTSAPE